MAPRAMWTGQLRLSLVNFGVRMYAATESASRVSMNQLHEDCHQRVKNQLVCPEHGPISRDEIVKGYEYEKDTYVIIEKEDLEAIKLDSSKVIELVQFVDADEIDALYIDSPYFIGPDGPVAEEPFAVIREAMKDLNKIAIGKHVMRSREYIVALQPYGKGFLMSTLRYAAEVREAETYFKDISDDEPGKEQIELAENIIKSKVAEWDPTQFEDRYRDAFFEMVKAKIEGAEPVIVDEEETPKSFNFMEALKQSVAEVEEEKAAASNGKKKKKKKKTTPKKPAAKSVSGSKKKVRKGA